MKLSISNIAWDDAHDEIIYEYLFKAGFTGIEIAPTRFCTIDPYYHLEQSISKAKYLIEKYGFSISSMQSIWFGRKEKIFGTQEDRDFLLKYTEKAIDYAEAIGCRNLVFGCPRNRYMDNPNKLDIAVDFFYKIGEYAKNHEVVVALEPNPVIYNTNFINTTEEALQFIRLINSKGLLVNMDLGTVIWNNENIVDIIKDINLLHHIHISEPNLVQIQTRSMHKQLKILLENNKYDKFISIEMAKLDDIDTLKNVIDYVSEVMR